MININILPSVVELFDTDVFFINNSPSQTGAALKDYIAGSPSSIVDTDSVLRADLNTGYASFVTALNLKDYCNNNPSPLINASLIPVYRNGIPVKTTALTLKSYLTGVPIDFLPIVVMAGQSNMEGPEDPSVVPPPYNGILTDAKVYYKNTTSGTTNGVIASLQYGINNNWRTTELDTHGPELSVGYQLPIELSHQIGIIKYSLGGSRLVDDGVTVSSAGLWDVDGNAARAGSFGLHFWILCNNFVKPAIQKYIAAGFIPKIAAFSWCQGESDSTIQYCADHYEAKLTQLLDEFKNQIRGVEPNVDNMEVVISRIHNHFNPGTRPYLTEVRAALQNVGTNYLNGSWIDTDSYPLLPDNIHWTKPGQITHGLDITNVLKTVL